MLQEVAALDGFSQGVLLWLLSEYPSLVSHRPRRAVRIHLVTLIRINLATLVRQGRFRQGLIFGSPPPGWRSRCCGRAGKTFRC